MGREIGRWRALGNAGLVAGVLAMAGFGMLRIANRQWRLRDTFEARASFANIGGLAVGDRVRVQGIDAGIIHEILPPEAPGRPVTLVLRIDAGLRPLVRSDALTRIVTQGVVGSKVVEIVPGAPEAPAMDSGGVLASEAPIELADILRDASASLRKVDAVAVAAREGLEEVNAIAAVIRRGEGTLGKLVRDDDAYRRLLSLSDRGERTLGDLEENLAALKRTWPLSRYFNDRSFFDRELVLFQPGSERESQTLRESDLFEPGRSVLTDAGHAALDEVADWFGKVKRAKTEVVIAAFTDDSKGEDLAQALTQEQADAVRKYLVAKHAIGSIGWFGSRKVAAVGFGSQVPRTLADEGGDLPARRVEIILFTPQS